ncbi:MAG: hypothetical protein WA666_07630 [Nitrospirota bacterium]
MSKRKLTGIDYLKLYEELEHLCKVERPESIQKLEEAKSNENLKGYIWENNGYVWENIKFQKAKEKHRLVEGRIREIRFQIDAEYPFIDIDNLKRMCRELGINDNGGHAEIIDRIQRIGTLILNLNSASEWVCNMMELFKKKIGFLDCSKGTFEERMSIRCSELVTRPKKDTHIAPFKPPKMCPDLKAEPNLPQEKPTTTGAIAAIEAAEKTAKKFKGKSKKKTGLF